MNDKTFGLALLGLFGVFAGGSLYLEYQRNKMLEQSLQATGVLPGMSPPAATSAAGGGLQGATMAQRALSGSSS